MAIKNKTKKHRGSNNSGELKKNRLKSPLRLNVSRSVGRVTDTVFPWSSITEHKAGEWPYVFQPKLKPKQLKRTTKLPTKKSQTDIKWLSKPNATKRSSSDNLFEWKPPEEKVSIESSQSSSISSREKQINLNLLAKKIKTKTKVSEDDKLPKYTTTKSVSSIPDWVEKNIPNNVCPKTVIQAGKPWHKSSECTWATELKYLSPLPSSKHHDAKSPKVDWGLSMCSFHKKIFDHEYRRQTHRKNLHKLKSINDQKSNDRKMTCLGLSKTIKKKPMEPIHLQNERDSQSFQALSPTDSIDATSPSFTFSTHELLLLSYSQKHDQKKEYKQPPIRGIEQPWTYLTQRRWPSNVVRTGFFKDFVKTPAYSTTVDRTKYPVYGTWPYVENMVKADNAAIGSYKTQKNYKESDIYLVSTSVHRSRLKQADLLSKRKKKASSMIINPANVFKKPFEDHTGTKTGHFPSELEQPVEILPSTINHQKFFPGFIEHQQTSIKPLQTEPAFSYQLSDLHSFELKFTHLLRKQKYLRTLIYYSVFNNENSYDPFQVITTERYSHKVPYLDVPSTGPASIYYPNGRVAIQCSYSYIENQLHLLTRRYTVYNKFSHRIEAVFDSLGNGIVYDKKGNIILNYSQNFGVRFLNSSTIKWRWHNIPVTEEIFRARTDSIDRISNIPNNEIQEMFYRNVNLYDNYLQSTNPKHKSEEKTDFNYLPGQNPIAYRSDGNINYGVIAPLKPFVLKLNDSMNLHVRDQKNIALKFEANEVKLTIQLGIILNPKIVLRTENIDFRLLPSQTIPCKFDKIVGETESLLKILKHVGNGKKLNKLKNEAPLIDFTDRVTNLIEDQSSDTGLENAPNLVVPSSDFMIKVTNNENDNMKPTKQFHKRFKLHDPRNGLSLSLKSSFYHNESQRVSRRSERDKVFEEEITKMYRSDNLLEGSNPIVSNFSFLLSNKANLQQYLKEFQIRR